MAIEKTIRWILAFLLLLAFGLFCASFAEAAPKRIVSLSPVGTEILYALGRGDSIIAVTKFCDYPPEAMKKPNVGNFAAIPFESLILSKTDMLVLADMHRQFTPQLDALGIPYVVLNQSKISDIYESIEALGKICGQERKAAQMNARIKKDISEIHDEVKDLPKRKTLVCVSRELSEPIITQFYAAGKDNFYDELVSLAGGENAWTRGGAAYPQVSLEGLIQLNPDVIIDLVGEQAFYHSKDKIDLDKVFSMPFLKGQWERSAHVRAVDEGHIGILTGTVYLRPGPRIARVLRTFAQTIHPEAFQ
jgi:iron complex transport system substrate-binding protein